jgi:hypothetical protein
MNKDIVYLFKYSEKFALGQAHQWNPGQGAKSLTSYDNPNENGTGTREQQAKVWPPVPTQVQQALNAIGWKPPLVVDGKLGPATIKALEWWKNKNDYPPGTPNDKAIFDRIMSDKATSLATMLINQIQQITTAVSQLLAASNSGKIPPQYTQVAMRYFDAIDKLEPQIEATAQTITDNNLWKKLDVAWKNLLGQYHNLRQLVDA